MIMDRTGIGVLALCLWAAVYVVRGEDVNVAGEKTYNQSTIWGTEYLASQAANGDTSGVFPINCIHTASDGDLNPWWEVDLERTYPVKDISIWARATFKNRLYPSNITVDGQLCTTITTYPTNSDEKKVTCSAVMYGQTVRITRQGNDQELNGDRTLNLCEMEIWVPSEVSQCTVGTHGTPCGWSCNNNCGEGPGKNACHQSDGYCYDGCVDGWYGSQCSIPCSKGCRHITCNRQTGECSPCNTGYRGDKCTVCRNGYYKYNDTCIKCSNNCQPQSCNSPSGRCQDCKDGYYGAMCNTLCPTNCQRCHRDTGVCLLCKPNLLLPDCTGCTDGYYKTMCNESCPTSNCQRCAQDTGECEECTLSSNLLPPACTDCRYGYYKISPGTCDRCSFDCLLQSCDSQNGTCHGCLDGRYGDMCNNMCPARNCVRCGQNTGRCEQCAEGSNLQLPDCNECTEGFYGDGCSQTCGNCEVISECRHDTGECAGQCAEGFTGSHCTEAVDEDNTPLIVGAVVAAVVVIAIVVVVVFIVMRRRKHAAKSRALESETSTRAQNGGERGEPARTASSPLSFAPVIATNDKKDARPSARVKPVPKPAVKPKPTSAGIYENVPAPRQNPASNNATPTSTTQSARQNATANDGHRSLSEPMTDDEELDSMCSGEEPIYSNDPAYTNFIPLGQLQKAVVDNLQDGKVAGEFQYMTGLKEFPQDNGKREENYYKNRFNSILPYDRNRVVLEQVGGNDASDYINASYIKGYKTDKAYIAAQGPKPNTVDDFWRMVWQEGVTDIVMLTNLKEGGNKLKCHEYWPAKSKSVNTGHMEVTGLEEEERAHFFIRTFSVRQLQDNEKRRVRQYHYVKWMDHEVPATTPLVNFWRYVRARAPRVPTAPPLLVHCSAGVGRTGTYIALDILIDQAQEEEEISLYQTVGNLRNYRCYMVQNKGQYEFLHEAVVEAYMSGHSRLDTSAFDRTFPNTIQHHQPHPRIDAEFERLSEMRTCLTTPSHTVASLEANRQKNRNPDALPDDKHLVYITEHAKERNQYINAVYMPTFLCSRGSIVTQLPLSDTVIDLWRLVDSWNVGTIVSIGQADGDEGKSRYWPQPKEPIKTGAYTISLKSRTSLGEHLDSYTVNMKKADKNREIRVLHYEAWTGEVADNVSDLIHLLDTLHASQKESTQEPIIIQCIDGAAKSGALCALWDVISRMTYDDEVDVYLAARHVHTVRPEAISSVVQYRFLYEVVQKYRASHSVYANT